ncbi:MAG: type II toxin-antitoxin system Phd/YefM family antitoxin [Melioribacteraceae bacterium]|nr:type II toxin-antitoxin system Phd/YefM family antitoxin [Melioribacteraceae bacterium]
MKSKKKKLILNEPEVIYRNNKPVSVIIDIEKYTQMLERLEDIEDLEYIESLRHKKLSFRKLDDVLTEINDV